MIVYKLTIFGGNVTKKNHTVFAWKPYGLCTISVVSLLKLLDDRTEVLRSPRSRRTISQDQSIESTFKNRTMMVENFNMYAVARSYL